MESPGGWYLLGRCPVPLFDASCAAPVLLAAGDREASSRSTKRPCVAPADCEAGRSTRSAGASGAERHEHARSRRAPCRRSRMQGVAAIGASAYPVARLAPQLMRIANRLVGNDEGAPVIEYFGGGLGLAVRGGSAHRAHRRRRRPAAPATASHALAPWRSITLVAGDELLCARQRSRPRG